MRAPADMPPRRQRASGRGRIVLIVGAVVVFVLFTSLRGVAGFYTDFLWYDSLGRGDVWSGMLRTQVLLGALFSAVFFVVLLVNLTIADRIAPTFRPSGTDDELLRRYQQVMDRRAGLVRAGVAAVCAVLAGAGMSAQWEQWLLFTNSVSMGQVDPLFGVDLGFYVFELPFLVVAVDWLFASLVIVLFITAIAHYLNGGIRLQSPIERVTPQVKAHLSVLLGLLALIKAVDYWLDRYELVFSTRGAVQGATYTDVNAQLPAIELLVAIALLSFGLFIVNIRRRGWVLPVVAVGLWAFVALLAGTAYPAFVQRFQVLPAQSSKEAPYVERNIAATRDAMGMGEVDRRPFEYEVGPEVGMAAVRNNVETLRNAQLLDPVVVVEAFRKLQQSLGFYQMPDVDVDRYPIRTPAGEMASTQAVLSARELNPAEIPGGSWENEHLVYTHGYGLALSAANGTTPNGQPDFLVKDIPVSVDEEQIDLAINQPEIYVGEEMPGYAIVGTQRDEVAYLEGGETVPTRYEGTGGVGIGTFARRAAFALRFGDWNPMVSGFMTPESKIIYIRDVRERVEMLAPFLSFDSDPYPVVVEGRLVYVVDAYTTSDHYPYAESAVIDGLPADADLRQPFNYVRNSVKAVVDAYDGTVTFYAMDEDDKVLDAWEQAFPDLFQGADEMSEELRQHVRYPQDLFRVQTAMWGRYHIDGPEEFLEQTNGWDVAQDAGYVPGQSTQGETVIDPTTGQQVRVPARRMEPYYQIVRLPGDPSVGMTIMRSFVPRSSDESSQKLTAFMAAKSDPDGYGKLISYEIPSNIQVDGPLQAAATIQSDDQISRNISLLNPQGQGSRVIFGSMLLLPMDDTLLYVRPLFVSSDSNELPELKYVIVVYGDEVVMEPTLAGAIVKLFGVDVLTLEETLPVLTDDGEALDDGEPSSGSTSTTTPSTGNTVPDDGTPPSTGEPSEPGDVAAELAEIQRLLSEAERSLLEDGDLGAYQAAVRAAEERLTRLSGALSSSTSSSTTSSTAVPAGTA